MRQKDILGLWMALAILAAVAGLAYRSIDSAVDTLGWVQHTNEALRELGEVNASYARAASARRAFVVAGDASQLEDVPELDARMHRTVAVLRASLADNALQVHRLDTLAPLLDKRLDTLQAAVENRRRDGTGGETAAGLTLTSSIREVREQMEGEENRLLAERDAQTRREMARTKLAVILGTFCSFCLLVVAFGRLRREVASRQRSEQAVLASEEFLTTIVENIPHSVFVKEAKELRYERMNRAGLELLGMERETLVGKTDLELFPRPQAESSRSRDREALAKRDVVDIPEQSIKTKYGERWLHTTKVPVFDAQGAPRYILGISEDVTEPRLASKALKAAKDSSEAANQELEAFSYSVAHDLRAPLRAIDGFALALEEDYADKLDADGIGHLRRVRAAAQRMGELIDGLLGLSRLSRGDIVRERVDLTTLARQSGVRLGEAEPQRHVDLKVEDDLVAEGDPRLLTAALDNLLGNAWKFTRKREHSHIEVGRQVEGDTSVFFVRDNGAGFDPAYADKLFGAFQRLHSAKDFEGTGIGLATVQRIVRRHGGRVWAEGAVDRGATIYFTL